MVFRKIYGRVRRGLGGGLRHGWRTVEAGPLKGLQFYLPESEEARWADRFLVGGYEAGMLEALGGLAREGGTLYDVGAHIGFYSCAWLHLGGESVEAFEPAVYNREVLRATIERNEMGGRVRVHEMALGAEDGVGTLVSSKVDVGAASAAYVRELGKVDREDGVELKGVRETAVEVKRLDGVFAVEGLRPPRVLKLDVEGAEVGVLVGARSVLEAYKPGVLCEVHSAQNEGEISRMLGELGYEMRVVGQNGPHPACLWWASDQ